MEPDWKILIIEDDTSIRELIELNLQMNGFQSIVAVKSGERGIRLAGRLHPDLILLDIMLPGISGLEVCRKLKSSPRTASIPIVMLTAKGEESDIVAGLELGATDYITKPFSNRVLVARIIAQLRRTSEMLAGDEITLDALTLNLPRHTVCYQGEPLNLTSREFSTLLFLLRHSGQVFTRNQIVSSVQGDDYPVTERSIDVQMFVLRKKLGAWASHIATVRGVGYMVN